VNAPRRPRRGASVVLLLALMFLGSLGLWIGIPLAWFWVGGRVQGATHSLGLAVGVVLLGVVVSIVAFVPALGWLNHKHAQARVARGLEDYGSVTLEGVLVVSAVLALVAFGLWFFVLSGAEPIPLGEPK
jgi:hypothetical protein